MFFYKISVDMSTQGYNLCACVMSVYIVLYAKSIVIFHTTLLSIRSPRNL
jgi:hypothetical protein